MTAPGREQDLGFESPAQSSGRPAVRRGKQCSRRDQVHAHAVPTGAQNWKFCAGSRQAVSAAASRAESAIWHQARLEIQVTLGDQAGRRPGRDIRRSDR